MGELDVVGKKGTPSDSTHRFEVWLKEDCCNKGDTSIQTLFPLHMTGGNLEPKAPRAKSSRHLVNEGEELEKPRDLYTGDSQEHK